MTRKYATLKGSESGELFFLFPCRTTWQRHDKEMTRKWQAHTRVCSAEILHDDSRWLCEQRRWWKNTSYRAAWHANSPCKALEKRAAASHEDNELYVLQNVAWRLRLKSEVLKTIDNKNEPNRWQKFTKSQTCIILILKMHYSHNLALPKNSSLTYLSINFFKFSRLSIANISAVSTPMFAMIARILAWLENTRRDLRNRNY